MDTSASRKRGPAGEAAGQARKKRARGRPPLPPSKRPAAAPGAEEKAPADPATEIYTRRLGPVVRRVDRYDADAAAGPPRWREWVAANVDGDSPDLEYLLGLAPVTYTQEQGAENFARLRQETVLGDQFDPLTLASRAPFPVAHNHVSTMYLEKRIDMQKLASRGPIGDFVPCGFSAVVLRIPFATALVFQNGKVVVTGAKSHSASIAACYEFVEMIERYAGVRARIHEHRTQNIVSTVYLRHPVNLRCMQAAYGVDMASYDSDLFPGLVFRPWGLRGMDAYEIEKQPVFIVYDQGKMVISGVKRWEDAIRSACAVFKYVFWCRSLAGETDAACLERIKREAAADGTLLDMDTVLPERKDARAANALARAVREAKKAAKAPAAGADGKGLNG